MCSAGATYYTNKLLSFTLKRIKLYNVTSSSDAAYRTNPMYLTATVVRILHTTRKPCYAETIHHWTQRKLVYSQPYRA